MINTETKEIDNLKINRSFEISNKIKAIFLLEEFLGGFEGKHILDIGCGAEISLDITRRGYSPDMAEVISKRGGIVYGLDQGFINRSKSYLERFRKETGVIPIPGRIEHIEEVLEGKQFDGIVSASVMGYPTKSLNWIEAMQKLYSLTKPGGYHCHFKLMGEEVNINRNNLEEIGFTVLSYFKENSEIGSALVLHKEYNS